VRQELVETGEQLIRAQAARDRNALRLQQLAAGGAGAPGDRAAGAGGAAGGSFDKENDAPAGGGGAGGAGEDEEPSDLIQGYLTRISRLEKEVRRLRQACPQKPTPQNPSLGVSARGACAWCGLRVAPTMHYVASATKWVA